ncbi:MAG TPA: oxidoreductase [Acidimicrobiaceae bacterium]|nr:oxidoreductase [Acidimicrobiaceae bacterium]
MGRRVLVLGGGTGGTLVANRLHRSLPRDEAEITVVDADDRHLYQPGLLFVPFGLSRPSALVRSRRAQLHPGIDFRQSAVDRVDLEAEQVVLQDGTAHSYDVLVVATGARLVPEETEGLTGPGWGSSVHTFYSLPGAAALSAALPTFEGGRLVVNMVDMPVKCPVAPLEFCFLADWYFHERGIRDRVEISYVTSLDGAFTKATCNRELSGLLAEKGVEVVTEFNTGQVDGEAGKLISYDGRQVGFDLAVMVPLHGGAPYVSRSPGLGDELGFVPTDEATLQAKAAPNVFVIGDATDLRVSKAGSVAHFQGEVLVRNIRRFLAGDALDASFDGHTNCFIESGFGKALLIDYNDDVEPVPGHFPGRFGLPLLRESRLNHLGKLAFQSLYWHALLPGRDIPGLTSAMPLAGKRLDAATSA